MGISFEEFKKEALSNPEVKEEYERLKPLFDIKRKLFQLRLSKGLTQEDVAKRIGTSKSNISRLENITNNYYPNLNTLIKYANALDCELSLELH